MAGVDPAAVAAVATGHMPFVTSLMSDHARQIENGNFPDDDGTATPEGFFLYSGSRRAYTTYRRELEVMAPAHYFGIDPGSAEIHDLALLGTGYAALTGFLHAAALLEQAGTTPEVFAPLAARWLYGMAEFLPELAREAGESAYAGGVSTVGPHRAGVDSLIQFSRARGIASDVHEPLKALLDRRAADGHGQDSFSSVFELLKARGTAAQ
ncbi:hypothetical protein ACH4RG_23825 [Streptomyces sp. NPDC021019]|uniref:imine reductase family protein n=1 Tax=Streptomyces sp. NPDC021019 TaxID=3365108 RepID=UPI00378C0901